MLKKRVVIRGDSAFAKGPVLEKCEEHEAFFAVVSPEQKNFPGLAESIDEKRWRPFPQANDSMPIEQSKRQTPGADVRRERTEARRKRDLRIREQ